MRFGTFLIAVLSALVLGLSVLLAMGCGNSGDSGTNAGTTSGQQTGASQQSETKAEESQSSETNAEESQPTESKPGESEGGESKAEPVRTGKPLSKAVLIKKGDAICAVVPNEYRSLASAMAKEREKAKKPKPTVQEIANSAAIPPLEEAAAKLQSLNPPAGDVPKLEAIVAALESAAQGLGENPNSEFGGPKSPFAEFQKLTKEYGLKGCAKL